MKILSIFLCFLYHYKLCIIRKYKTTIRNPPNLFSILIQVCLNTFFMIFDVLNFFPLLYHRSEVLGVVEKVVFSVVFSRISKSKKSNFFKHSRHFRGWVSGEKIWKKSKITKNVFKHAYTNIRNRLGWLVIVLLYFSAGKEKKILEKQWKMVKISRYLCVFWHVFDYFQAQKKTKVVFENWITVKLIRNGDLL